ncbi:hypothetical protein AYK21_02170 [Thermoplasmatales archaeon SG8-52-2]|nr:MAG: hypothetical protein AYK21_02170 [Thermoplasmatales archaeon SG8-52-2]
MDRKRFLLNKIIIVGIIILLIFMVITPSIAINNYKNSFTPINRGNLYVGGSGPGNYSKIQDAIVNASNGDTVFVYNGTFYESIFIDKTINLIGEDKNTTIIDGTDVNNNLVYIFADWVNISGFTIQNGVSGADGIVIFTNYNIITDNIVSNLYKGMYIQMNRFNNTIVENIIIDCVRGIELARGVHNNTIITNEIISNGEGVYSWDSEYNTITDNNISDNNCGIRLREYCNKNKIFNNYISNKNYGITLDDSNAIVKGNNITENIYGIYFDSDSTFSIIKDNKISNNVYGIFQNINTNKNNTIIENNIYSNTQNGIYIISPGNIITDNNLLNNNRGIYLLSCNSNTITGNAFSNDGVFLQDSYQNAVNNNTVNGKPLVYLENKSNNLIDSDAGQIILINCENINIKNQNISNTYVGIEIWNTNNSIISDNTLNSNNPYGVFIYSSQITLKENDISNNDIGVYLKKACNNTITDNKISNNENGIQLLTSSNNNTITNNIINSNTKNGIALSFSNDNTIYNNLFNNANNIKDPGNNIWNISKIFGINIIGGPYLGGNYWNDYTGVDTNSDGLGDTELPYNNSGKIHNGGDWLPLVNGLPYIPSNPNPLDGATDVSIYSELSWDGGDPDVGDNVTYDVYFGITNPPPKIVSNQSETTYNPIMSFNTTYYWKIVAWDNHDASSIGPIWSFTTVANNAPSAPKINGPIKCKPSENYNYSIVSFDPDKNPLLYYIDWGDGTTNDWDGPYDSGENVTRTHSWSSNNKTYIIRAKAKDIYGAESDWGYLEIEIPRPKSTFYHFFYWFLERFPVLEKLLNFII